MTKWVTVWGNATSVAEHRPETYAKNVTLRYPLTCAFGGSAVRLHFSNFCGTEPVTIKRTVVAYSPSGRVIDLKDAVAVTFNGEESVTIPAGAEIFSDEICFRVRPLSRIAVSFYLENFTLMRSAVVVTGPLSGGYFSVGDRVFSDILPLDLTRNTNVYYFLTGVDLLTDDCNRALIAYGDSITSQSWPDFLAMLFMSEKSPSTSVVRRAASGTRVLREYKCITYESYGLSGKHRFEREISAVSGADAVVIQQGINDIIHPVGTDVNPFRPMSDLPSLEELEEGIKYYLEIAGKHGLKTCLGTLLPILGWRTYASFREEMREGFNAWVRGSGASDFIADFDKALRSPDDVRAFKEGFDSGDHLHPSEEAYREMAKTAYEVLKR